MLDRRDHDREVVNRRLIKWMHRRAQEVDGMVSVCIPHHRGQHWVGQLMLPVCTLHHHRRHYIVWQPETTIIIIRTRNHITTKPMIQIKSQFTGNRRTEVYGLVWKWGRRVTRKKIRISMICFLAEFSSILFDIFFLLFSVACLRAKIQLNFWHKFQVIHILLLRERFGGFFSVFTFLHFPNWRNELCNVIQTWRERKCIRICSLPLPMKEVDKKTRTHVLTHSSLELYGARRPVLAIELYFFQHHAISTKWQYNRIFHYYNFDIFHLHWLALLFTFSHSPFSFYFSVLLQVPGSNRITWLYGRI